MALLRTNVKPHKGRFGPDQAPSGYGPSDLQSAYDLPSATAGSGATLAVVEAGGDPTAESDLAAYRAQYGLPACTTASGCFEQVNQEGQQGDLPPVYSDWPLESALDMEMASAICPNCSIIMVDADTASIADLGAAENEAVALGAKFISNSYGTSGESSSETSYDQYYNHPGVVITASAGDDGYGAHYPAASQYVTSVGGTTLTQDSSTSRGWAETAWGGTGSGCSAYEAKPAWQHDSGCGMRTDNDVAADADPNTGVAVYDTSGGYSGWYVVGGTSVASPVIAATYALAGTPAAGTYPASYPYVNGSGGLNDVTSGSNGGPCTPSYLCTAGPGYDGPTGLGSPNGTSAFTPVSYGTLSGTVTDASTRQPVGGATVTIGSSTETATSSGGYSFALAPGTYTVTASDYDHITKTVTGAQVSAGQATTQNLALKTSPGMVTLSGKITDGSGHGWPLSAEISVLGTPLQPVYSSPYTGEYSFSVPADGIYTVQVAAQYPGYKTASSTVKVGASGTTRNIKVPVDPTECDAPGYTANYDGGGTQFTGWSETKAKDGWTVTANSGGNGATWEFGDNPTGERTSPEPPDSDGVYAVADSNAFRTGTMDTTLTSPVVNLSGVSSPQISFDTYYREYTGQTAEVDLSVDGGQTWTSMWQQTTATVDGPVTIAIPQAADQSDVQVRFHYIGTNAWWWSLDNISIGAQSCIHVPGGLVDGTVTAANTGDPVNAATITETGRPHVTGTSAATADPAIPGGFYWLFSPAGTQTLTASHPGYAASTQTVDATRNAVTHQDWALRAGHLTMTPSTASVTVPMGAAKTIKVTFGNDGTEPVQATLGGQDGGYTPSGGPKAGVPAPPVKDGKPGVRQSSSMWTKITNYPVPIAYNAAAYDPQTGDVYSIGGMVPPTYDTTSSGYVYDQGTGKWSPIASLPVALEDAYAAFIDGTLYVVGGQDRNGDYLSTVWAYFPGSNTWTQMASMPDALSGGAAAVLGGQLYVIGGCDAADGSGGLCTAGSRSAYRYDPQANVWVKIARYPVLVEEEACAGIDSQIVCAGGESVPADGDVGISATYLYDPASNTWSQGADLPFPDYGMAYAGADGDLQVAVGQEAGSRAPAEQYDPSTNTWSTLPKPLDNVFGGGSSCGLYQIGGGTVKPVTVNGIPTTGIPTRGAEVLTGYDQCDGAGALSWLSENQDSVTVQPSQSVTVNVRLDSASVSQPGSYQATLYASTNTPYPPSLATVTMNVKPTSAMREVSGTVTAAGGHPLEDATVAITSTGQPTAAVKTNASGHYQWWLASGSGPVGLSAAKDGYQPQSASVAPAPGTPATANFTLKADTSSLPYTSAATNTGRGTSGAASARLTAARTRSAARSASASKHASDSHLYDVAPGSHTRLPAGVKAVCDTPAKGHAACMALVRTNVKPHKGRFAADTSPPGYGPSDLQSAYNVPSATAGGGQTVAVVDAGDDATAEADLAVYRAQYGLPPCTTANGCFEKVNQEGQQGNYPPSAGWQDEESLDLDMVSAICPNCHIILVEANSTSIADLGASVDEAVTLGAKFVSNSYGTTGESASDTSYDQYYNHTGVAVTASAGDSGYGVHYPAASPYVTSVGGTTLTRDTSTPRGWTETVWDGTGSGCSAYEAKPSWQTDTGCSMRTDNDVAAVANPDTGVAYYNDGWGVVGGTSVASPIIAATYALGGAPPSSDAPASYPYAHPSALNDVTSGSNGSCSPAYLCTAGPGYDGPTGLGTPDGTAAFTPATEGTLTGTVTSGGQPLAGAAVSVDGLTATTSSTGKFTVAIPAGTYTVTGSDFGYRTRTASAVQVTAGQATTQNLALAKLAAVTVSGTVSDGSGHKWPLYAEITVAGTPLAPVYTSPSTGEYSITVPVKATYTLDVAPAYTGYMPATITAHVGTSNVTKNIKVGVDKTVCDAPGYKFKYNGADEQFTGWTGTTPKDGWTVTDNNNSGYGWEFDDATGLGNLTGGTGVFAEAQTFTGPSSGVTENTSLISPVVNLSHNSSPQISFDEEGYFAAGQYTGEVDLSLDGGTTWQTVRRPESDRGQQLVTIPIPQAAGQSNVRVRFTFAGSGQALWQLDNIVIGTATCKAAPSGGLVTGVVTDANTGDPVNGATITDSAANAGVGTSAATGDPAIPGGFYWLFSPKGNQTLTAGKTPYASATAAVNVTPDTVTQQNWALQTGRLTVDPASPSLTEPLGQSGTVKLTYTNNGTAPLQVNLGTQNGGYAPDASTSGTARRAVTPAGSSWSSIAPYPILQISDSAVATDPQTGDVYSVGGSIEYHSPDDVTTDSYVYQPSTGQWSPIASLPQGLSDAGAAFINGTLYVAGGISLNNAVSSVYAYNPGANTWTQEASLPQAVANPGTAVLDGELYVIGGCSEDYGCDNQIGDPSRGVYRYSSAANTWTKLARYPILTGAEACAGIDGEVVCSGGLSSNDNNGFASRATWLYNPRSNHWSQGADLPYPDEEMAYAGANGKLQVAGGVTGEVNNLTTETSRVSQYNPATNSWTGLPSLSTPVVDASGGCGMYLIGGNGSTTSAQHLPGYDQCDGSGDTGWVKLGTTSLTLAPGASATVKVRLDSAMTTQPGTYRAMIYAAANAPYPVQVATVTMVVQPPQGWIMMHGKVASAIGMPVAGATVQIGTSASSVKSGQVNYTVQTGTNGRYEWWLDPAADDPIQVIAAKDGYIQQVVTITKPRASLSFTLNPFPSVPY